MRRATTPASVLTTSRLSMVHKIHESLNRLASFRHLTRASSAQSSESEDHHANEGEMANRTACNITRGQSVASASVVPPPTDLDLTPDQMTLMNAMFRMADDDTEPWKSSDAFFKPQNLITRGRDV